MVSARCLLCFASLAFASSSWAGSVSKMWGGGLVERSGSDVRLVLLWESEACASLCSVGGMSM